MSVSAIVAAAGHGSRLGRPKQLVELDGMPIAARSLETLARSPLVDSIVLVCEPELIDAFRALGRQYGDGKVDSVVGGGSRRQDSVGAGLRAIPADAEYVLVHDGARPFITQLLIERCVEAANRTGAAIVAVPVKDTIKRAGDGGVVSQTLPRDQLWAAQTPQVFLRRILQEAHERAAREGFVGTDDATLVEWAGLASVVIVEGSYENLKITTPEDLELAEMLARRQRAVR